MGRIATALVSFVVGSFLGFVLLAGFCSIPGLAFSVACGHNAPIWLPIFLPAGIAAAWLLLARLFGVTPKAARVANSQAGFKCGNCGAEISSNAASCSKCGFVFGGNANVA